MFVSYLCCIKSPMIHLTIPFNLLLHLVQQVDTLLLFLAAPKTVVLNYLLYQDLSDTKSADSFLPYFNCRNFNPLQAMAA